MNKKEMNLKILQHRAILPVDFQTQFGEMLEFVGVDEIGTKWFYNSEKKPIGIDVTIDEKNLRQINKEVLQIVFFFGLGSIKEILEVVEKANEQSVFVFIEPNLSILKTVVEIEDFAKIKLTNFVIVANKVEELEICFKEILQNRTLLLIKNMVFYFNDYYRKNELKLVKEYISIIGKVVRDRTFRVGNDVHDSLMGLLNNMQNLSALLSTPDVGWLKNCFNNYPVFVVAAGPSLDKNIQELKRVENKGIIIAVDTIAEKLVKNGIVPDFIASVERFLVWEYFYKNRPAFYRNSYLVGPPLLQPEVVDLFGTQALYPMRSSTREYWWLSKMLGFDKNYEIWMGGSCAHIATGLAMHLGCSPIVLVGQDLAYGEDISKTHAAGTEYDEKPEAPPEIVHTIEGYYGKPVKTQEIWNVFRSLYEDLIRAKKVKIINATEGGARIEGTKQVPLHEVISQYCNKEVDVHKTLQEAPKMKINISEVADRMKIYVDSLQKDYQRAMKQYRKLLEINKKWKINWKKSTGYILSIMKETDNYFSSIRKNELLHHNLQGPMMVLVQKFHTIPDDGSEKSLYENLQIHIEFFQLYTKTMELIIDIIESEFPWFSKEEKKC